MGEGKGGQPFRVHTEIVECLVWRLYSRVLQRNVATFQIGDRKEDSKPRQERNQLRVGNDRHSMKAMGALVCLKYTEKCPSCDLILAPFHRIIIIIIIIRLSKRFVARA